MKIRLFSTFAMAAMLLCGCTVEEILSEGGSILAEMENDRTRTSVTDEGAFTWSAGDQVWLETTSGYETGTLSSGAGSQSATFSYGPYIGEMTGKAVYPFNTGHEISGDQLSVVLPASYYLGTELTNTNAAMYGVDAGDKLKFSHLAGVMRFKFINVPAGTDRFVITLDKKINGTFVADLTEDHPVIETEATDVDAEKTITLNFDPLASAQDIMLYVPLPLGSYESLTLAVYAGSKSVWSYTNTVTNTINRKSLILMPTVTLSGSIEGDIEDFINLSENGTANCYVVSAAGDYRFTPTKGNSAESVGSIASVEVLWESFGTDVEISSGDLISSVSYLEENICFTTAQTYKEGNAVIVAKDASGTILWSWHIWLTDEPQEEVYTRINLIKMMDRNLGATSSRRWDVGALGLMYQWGRKDPFLGSSSTSNNTTARSTITWPSSVTSSATTGTIEYAAEHPTTYIKYNSRNYDWYYTGDADTDNARWQSDKTIYDPCPSGWRVPDGGENGVWNKAGFSSATTLNRSQGRSFSIGSPSSTWYPASGYLDTSGLKGVGTLGEYWSVTPSEGSSAYAFYFNSGDYVSSRDYTDRYLAVPVRCVKEDPSLNIPDSDDSLISVSDAVSLSDNGTANCYIVSEKGTYSFLPVKGNSSESVGSISSVIVLWESMGTNVTPYEGELIRAAICRNDRVYFKTNDYYREGNAVIAALDSSGKILWSWHIWMTDRPQECVHTNNAGTMMDRNLGATSADYRDGIGTFGLLYQWGRKDPFLGSCTKSTVSSFTPTVCASTYSTDWNTVACTSSTGTNQYAIEHPMTFITSDSKNSDWFYTGTSYVDNTRWKSKKTIYDPCPSGWRVPDAGTNSDDKGVWGYIPYGNTAFDWNYNGGIMVSKDYCGSDAWYPAAGFRDNLDGDLMFSGRAGRCWSCNIWPNKWNDIFTAFCFSYNETDDDDVAESSQGGVVGAYGNSVRCVKE